MNARTVPNEAEHAEQRKTIVTHRRLDMNPNASAAWMRRLSGNAVLGGSPRIYLEQPSFAKLREKV
ncbi:MAG TPA: hypothetical protein VMM76_27135 [Pirellulaceae bacterium]|nr:hypothetical protein [Pirellulaceae bacterium]